MTFLFLDRVASIVGAPEALVATARASMLGYCRDLPRDETRKHTAQLVIAAAHEHLRQPLIDAVDAHAKDAGDTYVMMTGEEEGSEGYRAAVLAAFDGSDIGVDLGSLPHGGATPEAVADQVLVVPDTPEGVAAVLARMGVTDAMLDAVVDEVLKPAPVAWSLEALAEIVLQSAERGGAMCAASGGLHKTFARETLQYLLCESAPELRATGLHMLDLSATDEALNAWLDERAMFSSPESDEADVAEVLRLINQKGGGSHNGLNVHPAADMTAVGAEPEQPAPAAAPKCICPGKGEGIGAHLLTCPMSPSYGSTSKAPVAAEPSDVTRAVTGALKTLFENTKESDTHVAEVLGVPKAVVAQARKDVTPWHPEPKQLAALYALVGRYNDALAAAAGALGSLPQGLFGEQNHG